MELDRIIMPNNRVYVPNFGELRKLVKNEMHIVPYVGHLGSKRTFASIRSQQFWLGMNKYIIEYIA